MKKLLATLIALAMVLSLAPVAMASAATVTFTDLKYLDGAENEISDVQTGLVYTSVTANLNGTGEQSVTLVVMLCDKATGKIKATDSDTVTLSDSLTSDTLKAGVTVNSLSDEEYKYFIWDGISTHTPLDNMRPAAPENFTDEVNKTNMIKLAWDAAYDDFDDVASYNVYRNGVLLSSGSKETTAESKYLDKNTVQNYTVEAIDGEGLVSAKREYSVATANVPNVEMSSDDPESLTGITEDNLWLWIDMVRDDKTGPKAAAAGTLGYTTPVKAEDAGGRACRETALTNRSDKAVGRFTAKVNPEYITADDENIIIEVTYFDDDEQEVYISYIRNDATPSKLQYGSKNFKKTATGMWKVASYRISNANFTYYMDDGTGQGNFRFWQGTSSASVAGLKVSNIAVAKRSEYDGDAAGLRVKDVPEIRGVIFYMDKAEAIEVDGVNCIEIDSDETLDFDITDSRLNGVGRVNVELEYLDEGTGNICVGYKTASSSSEKSVQLTDSGEWKTAVVEISDAAFDIIGTVSTDDLIISTDAGQPLRVKTIRVYDAR